MAQATASLPGILRRRIPLGSTWYVLRRWPIIPIFILVTLVLVGLFGPGLAPHNPIRPNYGAVAQPPFWHENGSTTYLLGTDHLGRDMLSRMVHGARISLVVVAVSLTVGMVIGTTLSLMAGYFGGNLDELIMRLEEVWRAVPFILIALVVVLTLGQSFTVLMVLLATLAASPSRVVRGEVLSLRTRDYVSLAKVAGASTPLILWRHILPNVLNTVIVIATLSVGGLILAEATLSFLGVGIPPPTPAWGAMVSDGRGHLARAWWIATFPGVAILMVVMAFNFMGDWIRDRIDPRLRQL